MIKQPDFDDDLSDIFGAPSGAPKALPQGDAFARIRAMDGQAPIAKPFQVTCPKCQGRGKFISYTGRVVGNCFTCQGKGHLERKTAPAQLERAKERRLEQKDAIRQEMAPQIAWLERKLGQDGLPEGYAKMLGDFLARLRNGQALTGDDESGQLGVIAKGMRRDAEWAAKRVSQAVPRLSQAIAQDAAPDVSKIVDAFQRAREAGLKRFTLRFEGAHFQADKSDPAVIWVSRAGYGTEKYGRIVGSAFRPGRDATAEVQARIAAIAADPLAAGIAYAQQTSSCSVCGRHLENQDSVDAGLGPICAGRLNRPGLKFVKVEGF